MSEGNKLPALSVEVKNFKRSYDKTVQRHIESVAFCPQKEKQTGASIYKGRKNRCESLADEWIQNENGLIDILENETNNEKHRVCLNTFEVKSQSKQNAAYENENGGGYRVIDQPADVCRWFLIIP